MSNLRLFSEVRLGVRYGAPREQRLRVSRRYPQRSTYHIPIQNSLVYLTSDPLVILIQHFQQSSIEQCCLRIARPTPKTTRLSMDTLPGVYEARIKVFASSRAVALAQDLVGSRFCATWTTRPVGRIENTSFGASYNFVCCGQNKCGSCMHLRWREEKWRHSFSLERRRKHR